MAMHQAGIWRIAFFAMIALSFLLLIAIILMMPLKTTQVKFVEFSSSRDNFFTVYPANISKSQEEYLVRTFLREYVRDRHSIDQITEKVRFEKILAATSQSQHQQFKDEYRSVIDAMPGIKRLVQVASDIALAEGVHQVEFKTTDTTDDGRSAENNWIVAIQYHLVRDKKMNEQQLLLNPLGLEVTKYSISKRDTKEGAAK